MKPCAPSRAPCCSAMTTRCRIGCSRSFGHYAEANAWDVPMRTKQPHGENCRIAQDFESCRGPLWVYRDPRSEGLVLVAWGCDWLAEPLLHAANTNLPLSGVHCLIRDESPGSDGSHAQAFPTSAGCQCPVLTGELTGELYMRLQGQEVREIASQCIFFSYRSPRIAISS